jgi:dolichyl-phosphate-mannose-protein mannosyltransferase
MAGPERRAGTKPRVGPKPDRILLAILAVALFVRLWGIADRLPDPTLGIDPIVQNTAVDEGDRRAMDYAWRMWRGGSAPLDLNPQTGDWPGLPFYLTLATQMLYRAYDFAAHGASTAAEFAARMEHDPSGMFLLGRAIGVLLGTLTVFLVYVVGTRLSDRRLGLAAALLLALNPFHVLTSQRVSDPNLLALLFVLLATVQLVRERAPNTRDSAIAGAMIGLAAASKYVPIVLLTVVALAQVERVDRGWRVRWKAIGAAVLAAAIAFFAASPYTILDWSQKSFSMTEQRWRLLSEWVGLSEAPISLPTYLTRTFPAMLGWPGYLMAIAGTALLFAQRSRGWVVAAVPILLLLPTGTMALAAERFMVPAIGSLVVAAAFAILRVAAWRSRLAPALLALVVAWPLPGYVRTRMALGLPDTRALAHAWIRQAIPGTEPMALDVYGPEFPPRFDERLAFLWPFMVTNAQLVRPAYRPEWLDGLRYYVTSSEVERRFTTAARHYPAEAAFHRWIRAHGTVVWSSDSLHASGPRLEVRALPDRISTREQRDAAWTQTMRGAMNSPRLAHWCSEMSSVFLRRGQYDRAEEWGTRGLGIQDTTSRKSLYETLALAQVQLGRLSEAEATARAGLVAYPESPLLHVDRAMALEGLGRVKEGIEEYRQALKLDSSEESAAVIRGQIARLEQGSP